MLLRQAHRRAQSVLTAADTGNWPERELHELLHYLRLEVLRQVVDEEWLLFRAAHHAPDELALLRRDHLELRLAVDALAATEGGRTTRGPLAPHELAEITTNVLAQLEAHLAAEEKLLAASGKPVPGVTTLGGKPHEWYALTEGPMIDLEQLPGERGADAALDRLLRLRPGEHVELRCDSDPSPLWQQLTRADVGAYGVEYLERGPRQWRVVITRREGCWIPAPHA